MLKKLLKCCGIMFMLLISFSVFSACCSQQKYDISVVFANVDEGIGIEDYTYSVVYSYDTEIEFKIPEGYDSSNMTATLNGKEVEFETIYENAKVAEDGYNYATAKTIKFQINKVLQTIELKFDMSSVKYKQFDITIDSELLSKMQYNGYGEHTSNLKALVVPEDLTNNLRQLNKTDILQAEEFSIQGRNVTLDYNSNVILCYNIKGGEDVIDTMYSSVGYFSDRDRVKEHSAIEYIPYNVSKLGNQYYYLCDGNTVDVYSRLYYVGKLKEDINLCETIPMFQEQTGFNLENNENIFSLLTNYQNAEFNSSLLNIEVYQPTNLSYDAGNFKLDKLDNQTLEKIDKFDNSGNIKNSILAYDIYDRYDVYNMYIGGNIEEDTLLTSSEKSVLSNELYVAIKTSEPISNLSVKLINKEKNYDNNLTKTITEFVQSERGTTFFKIDKELIKGFLLERGLRDENNQIINYETGNAILFVDISTFIDKGREFGTNQYTAINYDIEIVDSNKYTIGYNDYRLEMFTMDDHGIKDYGFVDFNSSLLTDYVYFKTSSLFDQNDKFLNNLYISVLGPEYSGYEQPVMILFEVYFRNIFVLNPPKAFVEDAKVFNGVKNYPVNIAEESGNRFVGDQYRLDIDITLTSAITGGTNINISELELGAGEEIFVSNNNNLTSVEHFEKITNSSMTSAVSFGLQSQIYYFVASYIDCDFDIYLRTYNNGVYSQEKQLVSATEKLLDIAGNEVQVEYKGKKYNVYVKYQTNHIYEDVGSTYWLYRK